MSRWTPLPASLPFLLLVISPFSSAQQKAPTREAVAAAAMPSVLRIDEAHTSVAVTFRASRVVPGTFVALTVTVHDHPYLFIPHFNVMRVPIDQKEELATGLASSLEGFEVDATRRFLVGTCRTPKGTQTFLLFRGHGEDLETSPGLLLGFQPDGTPFIAMESQELAVTALAKSAAGALLVGQPTFSEALAGDSSDGSTSPYATTYDPLSVYLLPPGLPAQYSLPESKTYNRAHYVWAGQHASEKVAVLYNIPGHGGPFTAAASQANAIVDAAAQRRSPHP